MIELILGGARSGKSKWAESLAESSRKAVVYIATGQAFDESFAERIQKHIVRRPSEWLTVEEPLDLLSQLQQHASADHCVLVDCLTLWVTNLLCREDPSDTTQQLETLVKGVSELPGHIIFVSNEVSLGVLPEAKLSRDFIDIAGTLHQQLAEVSDRVTLVVAGLPLYLKGAPAQ